MAENRVAYGAMAEVLRNFKDVRGDKRTSYEYTKGDIIPVDSPMLYTVHGLVTAGMLRIIPSVTFQGYESDYNVIPYEFVEFSLLKFRFKTAGKFVRLPSLTKEEGWNSYETLVINDGTTPFGFKYPDGTVLTGVQLEPRQAFNVRYFFDDTVNGRWIFEKVYYLQDGQLEQNTGSVDFPTGGSSGGGDSSSLVFVLNTREAITAGQFVAMEGDETGSTRLVPASKNSSDKVALGFVKQSYPQDVDAVVYLSGENVGFADLVVGSKYYLGNNGGVELALTDVVGEFVQELGFAKNSSTLIVNVKEPLFIED